MSSQFLIYIKEQMWVKRYAKRTIESYIYWIKAYINFNKQKHPNVCHDQEVENFLSYLSNVMNVAPKTQALALNAIVFLYEQILKKSFVNNNVNRLKSSLIFFKIRSNKEIRWAGNENDKNKVKNRKEIEFKLKKIII